MREFRDARRAIYYTDETWANKNMRPGRVWTDMSSRARLDVPSGKGARIIISHFGSRETGRVTGAGLLFKVKKKTGDYHGEMNSDVWLKWLATKVLPKICGGVLVIDRAPYHKKQTYESRPASSKMNKSQLAGWLEQQNAVPTNWPATWLQSKTVPQLREQAAKH